MKLNGAAPSTNWWLVKRKLLLAVTGSLSLATWGLAVLLMQSGKEWFFGGCAGIAVIGVLLRSLPTGLSEESPKVPLWLFVLSLPALAGFFFIGIFGGLLSSIVVLGLSILWLLSNRFHRAVGLVCFVLETCTLLLIPADLILRRRNAGLDLEPNPAFPLVHRFTRMVSMEDNAPGELSRMLGTDAFAENAFYRGTSDCKGFRLVSGSSESRPYDIVLLGDSYTAQSLVGTWPDLLGQHSGFNVRNLAIPSAGPWEEYINLRLEYPDLRLAPGARILWCLFSGNDLDNFYGPLPFDSIPVPSLWSRWGVASQNFRQKSWIRNTIKSAFTKNAETVVQTGAIISVDRPDGPRMLFLRHYIDQARKSQFEIEAHPSFPALDSTIQFMAAFVRSKSLSLTVLVFPSKADVYRWLAEGGEAWSTPAAPTGFGKAVQGLCKKYGIPCHDLTPEFVENSKKAFKANGEALWLRDDTHWNEKGNQLTARIVTDIIRGR